MSSSPLPRLAGACALVACGLMACTPSNSRRGPYDPGYVPEADMAGAPAALPDLLGATDDLNSIDPGGPGPDDPCSEEKFSPMKVGDPDIVLVMDKSSSMTEGTPSKWDQTVGAVSAVITQLEANGSPIQWGLIMFPTDGNCGVDPKLPVTVGMGKGKDVVNFLMNDSPNGNTPLGKAIDVGMAYYDTLKDGRGHYFLVATDGEPNCDTGGFPPLCLNGAACPAGYNCVFGICVDPTGGAATKSIAAALAKGIKSYIVGISLSGTSSALNGLAQAGGTARPGNVKYYPVMDQPSLEAALKNITSQIISCSFALTSLPMANQMIIVTIGGQAVQRDANHMNGWDLDPKTKTLTFYGASCTNLQANPGVVSVGYTCPPPG